MGFVRGLAANTSVDGAAADRFRNGLRNPANLAKYLAGQQEGMVVGAIHDAYVNVKDLVDLVIGIAKTNWVEKVFIAYRRRAAFLRAIHRLLIYLHQHPDALEVIGEELGKQAGAETSSFIDKQVLTEADYQKAGRAAGTVMGVAVMESVLLFTGPEDALLKAGTAWKAGRAAEKSASRLSHALQPGSKGANRILEVIHDIPELQRYFRVDPRIPKAVWGPPGWIPPDSPTKWFQWEEHVREVYQSLKGNSVWVRDVEFDGLTTRNGKHLLIDAKFGFENGFYDIRNGPDVKVWTEKEVLRGKKVSDQAERQVRALAQSLQEGGRPDTTIAWVVPDQKLADVLNQRFADMGTIKVGRTEYKVADLLAAEFKAPPKGLTNP